MDKSTNLAIPSFLLNLSPATVVSYLLIDRQNRHLYFDESLFTPEILGFLYNKNPECGERFLEGLDVISQHNYITKVSPRCYVSERKVTNNLKVPFVNIYETEFLKIINSGKQNVDELLLFYLRLLDSFDYSIVINNRRKIVGHMSQSFFVNQYGMSKNTVTRYFKTLEDLGILFICRAKPNTQQTNLYGRKEDEALINQYANRFDSSSKSNFHRSVSARYNRFINDPEVFSTEEIRRLYHDCEIYNQDVSAMGHPEKAKALDKIKPL